MHAQCDDSKRSLGHAGFVAAAVFGTLHAAISLYWAIGGTWLLWSLGNSLLQTFEGREWILIPVGFAKLLAALTPLILASCGWPARRLTRAVSWTGASLLILWGGLNTVIGNLVLMGAIQPASGFDRPGMIGHAWLWDPLFLVWGIALMLALLASRKAIEGARAGRAQTRVLQSQG